MSATAAGSPLAPCDAASGASAAIAARNPCASRNTPAEFVRIDLAALGSGAGGIGTARGAAIELHAVVSRVGENDVRHVVPDRVELAERVRGRRDCLNPVCRPQPEV